YRLKYAGYSLPANCLVIGASDQQWHVENGRQNAVIAHIVSRVWCKYDNGDSGVSRTGSQSADRITAEVRIFCELETNATGRSFCEQAGFATYISKCRITDCQGVSLVGQG